MKYIELLSIIADSLVDSDYNETLSFLKERLSYSFLNDKDRNETIKIHKSFFSEILALDIQNFQIVFDKNTNKAILNFHKSSTKFSDDGLQMLFTLEKLYYDLFHKDQDFKPELLKYIDPESGDLREEFKKDKQDTENK